MLGWSAGLAVAIAITLHFNTGGWATLFLSFGVSTLGGLIGQAAFRD
jgi:hypothetical protein